MNATAATFEVQQDGQRPRLFRFSGPRVSIGFAARCDLSLEPHADGGAELELVTGGDPCLVHPKSVPGAFSVNGKACASDTPVKAGDVITIKSHQITIRTLPAPESAAPAPSGDGEIDRDTTSAEAPPAVAGKKAESAPARTTSSSAPAAGGKAGLSYLYLFFAPVQEFLMDDDVTEVMINGPHQVYVERKGKLIAVPARFANEQSLQAAVMNVARSVGRFFDRDNPRLDARLPDGSRVHAVMPPLCRAGTTVAIRKFRREKLTIPQLISFGSITEECAQLLNVIVKVGKNLIVSGATSSGKTSVLNVLSGLIPENDRILVLEDASELQLQQTHKVCFETRKPDEYGKGEVTIRDLLHSALRLRPDRIIVGEIRGGEALDLLQAMNTGHEGSMSTIHANSARDSLSRLEVCALLSGIEIPLSALREQVGSAIHIVIQTARLHDGTRKITAITEVLGLRNGEYHLEDIMVYRQDSLGPDGKIIGRHEFTGYKPSFLEEARHRGMNIDKLFAK
jgi:pilus assembly protein CpaF